MAVGSIKAEMQAVERLPGVGDRELAWGALGETVRSVGVNRL